MSSPTSRGYSRVSNNYPAPLAKLVREAKSTSVDTKVRVTKMSDEMRRQLQARVAPKRTPASAAPSVHVPHTSNTEYVPLSEAALLLNRSGFAPESAPHERRVWLLLNHPKLYAKSVYCPGHTELCVPALEIMAYALELSELSQAKVARNPRVNSHAKRLLKDVDTCSYCGRQSLTEKDPDGKTWHMDHVRPFYCNRSLDVLHNIVKCCVRCSRQKGKKELDEVGMRLLPATRYAALDQTQHDLLMSLRANTQKWHRVVSSLQDYALRPRLKNQPSRALASPVTLP